MADVLFLAIIGALLGVSVLFVRACDRIIGDDDGVIIATEATGLGEPEAEAAAA